MMNKAILIDRCSPILKSVMAILIDLINEYQLKNISKEIKPDYDSYILNLN